MYKRQIQSGVHYSEMLPLEYEPSPAYLAAYHDALERYAGITSANLADTSGVPYLEDYDAWYTFTSDFGPGTFVCAGGQVEGDTALLWTADREDGYRTELTLQKDGENWYIRAHRNTADQALLERLANLTAEDIGYVSWYGSNEPPSAEELAELLRQAAEKFRDLRMIQGPIFRHGTIRPPAFSAGCTVPRRWRWQTWRFRG